MTTFSYLRIQVFGGNMNHSVNYELSDARRQEVLREFTKASDPEDLRAELAASRLLASEAMEAGQTALAGRLLEVVAKCAQGQVAVKRAKGELLERVAALRLVKGMCDVLAAALDRHSLPEPTREAIVNEVADGMDAVFEEIEPKQIGYERPKQ